MVADFVQSAQQRGNFAVTGIAGSQLGKIQVIRPLRSLAELPERVERQPLPVEFKAAPDLQEKKRHREQADGNAAERPPRIQPPHLPHGAGKQQRPQRKHERGRDDKKRVVAAPVACGHDNLCSADNHSRHPCGKNRHTFFTEK